jgi:hypothetical protein
MFEKRSGIAEIAGFARTELERREGTRRRPAVLAEGRTSASERREKGVEGTVHTSGEFSPVGL